MTVEVEDPYGNLVSSLQHGQRDAGDLRPGARCWALPRWQAAGGVATFSNLSIDQAGSYSLTASAAGVGGTATSNSFNVTAGAAAQLAFTTQPANTPGANTMANVKVAVEDQYGNTVTTDNSSVTLDPQRGRKRRRRRAQGHGYGQSASGGVATFSGLSIVDPSNTSYSAAGTGYTLTASDTDNGVALPAGKSAAFNTTLIVTSCTMTPTGFVATFSQPFKVATTPLTIGPNLYSAVATDNLPVNVALIGSNEGTVRGSLVLNSTDTQITFVATTLVHGTGLPIAGVSSPDATSGILAPDSYTVVLDSTKHELRNDQRPTAGRHRQRHGRQQLQPGHGGGQLGRRGRGDPLLRPRPEQLDRHQHGQRAQRSRRPFSPPRRYPLPAARRTGPRSRATR